MTSWPCYDPKSLHLLLSLAQLKQPRALLFLSPTFRDPVQDNTSFSSLITLKTKGENSFKTKFGTSLVAQT